MALRFGCALAMGGVSDFDARSKSNVSFLFVLDIGLPLHIEKSTVFRNGHPRPDKLLTLATNRSAVLEFEDQANRPIRFRYVTVNRPVGSKMISTKRIELTFCITYFKLERLNCSTILGKSMPFVGVNNLAVHIYGHVIHSKGRWALAKIRTALGCPGVSNELSKTVGIRFSL
jgi:hypothetical protein